MKIKIQYHGQPICTTLPIEEPDKSLMVLTLQAALERGGGEFIEKYGYMVYPEADKILNDLCSRDADVRLTATLTFWALSQRDLNARFDRDGHLILIPS